MSTHHVPIRAQPVTGQTTARFSMATEAIHADNGLARQTDLAMPIHVSTTFSYPRNPDELQPLTEPSVSDAIHKPIKPSIGTPKETSLLPFRATLAAFLDAYAYASLDSHLFHV